MPARRGLHVDADLVIAHQGRPGVQVAASGDEIRIRLTPRAAWALWRDAPDRTTRRRWRAKADAALRHADLTATLSVGPLPIARLGRPH